MKTATTPTSGTTTIDKTKVESARAARRATLDSYLTQSDAAFTEMGTILARIAASYNAELTTVSKVIDVAEIKNNLDSIATLQKKLSVRSTQYADPLKAAKAAYYQAETTANGGSVSLDVQDKFWSQVEALKSVEAGIKQEFETVKQAASNFATKKAQKLSSDIASITESKQSTQDAVNKDPIIRDVQEKI